MIKSILFALSVFSAVLAQAADGVATLQLGSLGAGFEVEKTGSEVKGHYFSQSGASFVNLKKSAKGWTGRLGNIVVSQAEVKCASPSKCEVELATMPGSFSNFTVKIANSGEIEFSGTVNGRLASAKLDEKGLFVNGYRTSLKLSPTDVIGRYDGSFTIYTQPATFSSADLRAAGTLDLYSAAQDLGLFSLLYVLPFVL